MGKLFVVSKVWDSEYGVSSVSVEKEITPSIKWFLEECEIDAEPTKKSVLALVDEGRLELSWIFDESPALLSLRHWGNDGKGYRELLVRVYDADTHEYLGEYFDKEVSL